MYMYMQHTVHYFLFTCIGVRMSLHGEERVVRGAVLFTLADTLAAHSIKIGVGFALRKCRMCMATKEQAATRVH